MHLTQTDLPPLKEGVWSCDVVDQRPPAPAGEVQWGASSPGEKSLPEYPDPIPADSPMVYTCLLRSPESERKVYLVPFIQEAGRLLLIGKPIPIRKDMNWAEEGPPRPGRPNLRYSVQEQAVVLFSQGPSAFWVVLGLLHPPYGTGDGGGYVYEVYRVAQKEARAVAEFTSGQGFEPPVSWGLYFYFYRGCEGELEIAEVHKGYDKGSPDGSLPKQHLSKTTHLVWDGKQFVPLGEKISKDDPHDTLPDWRRLTHVNGHPERPQEQRKHFW